MAAPLPPPAAPPIAAPAPAPIRPPPTARWPGSYGFVHAAKPSTNANATPPGARDDFVMYSPVQQEIGLNNTRRLGRVPKGEVLTDAIEVLRKPVRPLPTLSPQGGVGGL